MNVLNKDIHSPQFLPSNYLKITYLLLITKQVFASNHFRSLFGNVKKFLLQPFVSRYLNNSIFSTTRNIAQQRNVYQINDIYTSITLNNRYEVKHNIVQVLFPIYLSVPYNNVNN